MRRAGIAMISAENTPTVFRITFPDFAGLAVTCFPTAIVSPGYSRDRIFGGQTICIDGAGFG